MSECWHLSSGFLLVAMTTAFTCGMWRVRATRSWLDTKHLFQVFVGCGSTNRQLFWPGKHLAILFGEYFKFKWIISAYPTTKRCGFGRWMSTVTVTNVNVSACATTAPSTAFKWTTKPFSWPQAAQITSSTFGRRVIFLNFKFFFCYFKIRLKIKFIWLWS